VVRLYARDKHNTYLQGAGQAHGNRLLLQMLREQIKFNGEMIILLLILQNILARFRYVERF